MRASIPRLGFGCGRSVGNAGVSFFAILVNRVNVYEIVIVIVIVYPVMNTVNSSKIDAVCYYLVRSLATTVCMLM